MDCEQVDTDAACVSSNSCTEQFTSQGSLLETMENSGLCILRPNSLIGEDKNTTPYNDSDKDAQENGLCNDDQNFKTEFHCSDQRYLMSPEKPDHTSNNQKEIPIPTDHHTNQNNESSLGVNIAETGRVTINVGQIERFKQINLERSSKEAEIEETNKSLKYLQFLLSTSLTGGGILYYNSVLLSEACSVFKKIGSKLQHEVFVSSFREACYTNSIMFPFLMFVFIVLFFVIFLIPLFMWREKSDE